MAHVAKFTKSASGKLMKHYERTVDENGKHINYGNIDIDLTKTHLNYNLAPERSSQLNFLKERLDQVYVFNRKDVNVMADWVVTLPQEFPADKEKEFFKKSYAFLSSRYGEENVISAYVHVDETTPHMHFSFIPIIDDPKKGPKVNAKDRLNKFELKQFHTEFSNYMDKNFGFDVGILNGATKGGNKTKLELQYQESLEMLNKSKLEVDSLKSSINSLKTNLKAIMDISEGLDVSVMIQSEKKGLKKDKELVNSADLERLKNLASSNHVMKAQIKTLTKKLEESTKELSKLKIENNNLRLEAEYLESGQQMLIKTAKFINEKYPEISIEIRDELDKQDNISEPKLKIIEHEIEL